jgi:hypothetical protein
LRDEPTTPEEIGQGVLGRGVAVETAVDDVGGDVERLAPSAAPLLLHPLVRDAEGRLTDDGGRAVCSPSRE